MNINASRLQSYFEAMSEIGKIGETDLILRGGLPVAVRYMNFSSFKIMIKN